MLKKLLEKDIQLPTATNVIYAAGTGALILFGAATETAGSEMGDMALDGSIALGTLGVVAAAARNLVGNK